MKQIQITLLFITLTFATFARTQPKPNVGEEYNDKTPASEIVIYDGEEYIKSYNYIYSFAGYVATLCRKDDFDMVDSISKLIVSQQKKSKQQNGKKHRFAIVRANNIDQIFKIVKRGLSNKDIQNLSVAGVVCGIDIIADSKMNPLHVNIYYRDGHPEIEPKIIKLQELLLHKVSLLKPSISGEYDYYQTGNMMVTEKNLNL